MNLINPVTFVYAMLGCLISIGGATSASIAMGKEEDAQVSAYAALSLILSFVIPIIFSAAGIFFFRPFLGFLGAKGALFTSSAGYGRVMILGGVFTTLMYYPFNFLRVDGRAQYSMVIFGVMGVMDVIFVFIFYHLGLTHTECIGKRHTACQCQHKQTSHQNQTIPDRTFHQHADTRIIALTVEYTDDRCHCLTGAGYERHCKI